MPEPAEVGGRLVAGGGSTCEVEAVGMGATRRLLRTPCCEMSARSPSQSHRWLQKHHVLRSASKYQWQRIFRCRHIGTGQSRCGRLIACC